MCQMHEQPLQQGHESKGRPLYGLGGQQHTYILSFFLSLAETHL